MVKTRLNREQGRLPSYMQWSKMEMGYVLFAVKGVRSLVVFYLR